MFVEKIIPERKITITVLQRQSTSLGSNEVWLAQRTGTAPGDLFPVYKNAKHNGNWEYRDATKYGYSNNVIISYGNNEGNSITFKSPELTNCEILVWKSITGGVIRIEHDGIKQVVDLYSAKTGGEYSSIFPFKDSKLALALKMFINFILMTIIFSMLCFTSMHLYRGVKLPRWFITEYNYKYAFLLFLVIYAYDIWRYKQGIPNFMQFGDQLYYWNATKFFADGTFNLEYFIDNTVCFRGYLCNLIPFISQLIANENMELFDKYIEERSQIFEQQKFINQQQKIIDEKQTFINQQHEYIQKTII